MKKIYMVVFALLVIFSFTMSATALETKIIDRQNGKAAYADWVETTPEGIITKDTYLSVTQSNIGTDIYLSICSYNTDGSYSCKYGYTLIQDDVFSMDKKLNTANLESVQIDLYEWTCDEYGNCWETVDSKTIDANWAGTGDVSKGSYKYMSKSGDYMSKFSGSSSYRGATVTGSLNGLELGQTNYGAMVIFKQASISMQK
jgi:hypothetical protein